MLQLFVFLPKLYLKRAFCADFVFPRLIGTVSAKLPNVV